MNIFGMKQLVNISPPEQSQLQCGKKEQQHSTPHLGTWYVFDSGILSQKHAAT